MLSQLNLLKVLFTILVISLMGCASHQTLHKKATLEKLPLEFKSPKRMRFSGKGAGAGMMLMSSMGPTGIAIGVAIDEGIGKEIEAALHDNNFSFQSRFASVLNELDHQKKLKIKKVLVERYGFKTQSTEGFEDAIVPEIQLKVLLFSGDEININFPSGFESEVSAVELSQAKESGTLSSDLLNQSIKVVVARISSLI